MVVFNKYFEDRKFLYILHKDSVGEAFRINFLFLIFKRNLVIMLPERVESVEAGGVMASTPCQL